MSLKISQRGRTSTSPQIETLLVEFEPNFIQSLLALHHFHLFFPCLSPVLTYSLFNPSSLHWSHRAGSLGKDQSS